jgi:drug/metabolite transporter (DMT)-like permease
MSERNRRGIAAMVIAAAVFSLMDTGLKLLSAHYPALQVTALRSLSSMPLILAYVAWRTRFAGVWRVRWPLHLLRGVMSIGILSLFAVGVRRLPLSEAYSIVFIAPLLITAMSAVILKERVDVARWAAVAAGLLALVGCAVCYAVTAILVRILGRTDSGESLVLWLSVVMSAGATALAAPAWVAVRFEHAWILAVIAVSGFVGQLAITEAFRKSDASAVAPFEYTALAWGVAIDWLLWRVLPDRFTLLGAAIIIASGLYLVRRERGPVDLQ